MRAKWEKVAVRTGGMLVPAIAPVVVSASRATDIPAFYGEWFVGRIKAGHLVWTNPFNPLRTQVVSFARTRAIVFWSKNPAPLERHLHLLDERGINYYFTFTLNDYEQEGLERSVPPLAERVATFRRLAERLGSERVIWRFDPIVVGGPLTPARILEKIERIGEAVHRHTKKLVVSFVDIAKYRTVRANLRRSEWGDAGEPGAGAVQRIARGIQDLNRNWGLSVASCAEPYDLVAYGIARNRCVDDELMARVFSRDGELMRFLGRGSSRLAGEDRHDPGGRKDPGQRKLCGCIVSKDIGRYDTCPHHCVYCYANSSPGRADDGFRRHAPDGERL